MSRIARLGAAVVAAALGAGQAGAASLNGVTLPDTAVVHGTPVKLNGMGVRTRFFVSVYTAGLYLERPTGDASAAVDSDQAKRVVLVFQHDVTEDQLREAFNEGFGHTDPAGALAAQVAQFIAYFTGTMKSGEEVRFDYAPGVGTTTTVRGQEKPTIPGADFMQALLGIWLGKNPPNESLKQGLLGAH